MSAPDAFALGGRRIIGGALAINIEPIATAYSPAGEGNADPRLVAPDDAGGWTFAAWDGENWHDIFCGELLEPSIWMRLPPAHMLALQRLR